MDFRRAKKYYRLSEAISASEANSVIVMSKDENCHFLVFESHSVLKYFIMKSCSGVLPKNYNEHVSGLQKPYFDIDAPGGTDLADLISSIKKSILSLFPYIKDTNIITYSSSDSEKTSYHIIVDDWYVNDGDENRAFCDTVLSRISQDSKYVDRCVYKKNQFIRLPFCTKNGKRPKVICDKQGNDPFLSGCITNIGYCAKIPIVLQRPTVKHHIPQQPESVEIFLGLLETNPGKLKEIMGSFTVLKVAEDNILCLKRIKASWCPICDRVHENDGAFICITSKNSGNFYCRRDPERKRLPVSLGEEQTSSSNPPCAEKTRSKIAPGLSGSMLFETVLEMLSPYT